MNYLFNLILSMLIILPISIYFHQLKNPKSNLLSFPSTQKVLLVIAHPDDEVMFFAPTILQLTNVYVLCLSNGNFDGLGKIREKELIQSCLLLNLKEQDRIVCLDDPKFQDGMGNLWSELQIEKVVLKYIKRWNIDTVLTFDQLGISFHPNHIQTHYGVKRTLSNWNSTSSKKSIKGFQLKTISTLEKYFVPSQIIQLLLRKTRMTFVSSPTYFYRACMAMVFGHKSQMVWFRYLYISFSSYMWINSWEPLDG